MCVECTGRLFSFQEDIVLGDHVSGQANSRMSLVLGFPFTFNADGSAGTSPHFTVTDASSTQTSPVSADILHGFLLFASAGLVRQELAVPWWPGAAPQVRAPGLGELGSVWLAAQWVWMRPPFGHRTNAGSQKGLWHFWHNFLSESRIELPFNFICENKHRQRSHAVTRFQS